MSSKVSAKDRLYLGPAEAIGVVGAVVQGRAQIVYVELVMRLAAARIAVTDPKLCCYCSVLK